MRYFSVFLLLLIGFASARAQNAPLTTRYIHPLRMSVRLPSDWTPQPTLENGGRVTYAGDSGFVQFALQTPPSEDETAVRIPLPTAIIRGAGRFDSVWLIGTPDQLDTLAATVRFPDSLTAPQFVEGALDVLQAEYLYSSRVDWATLRQDALIGLADNTPLEIAYDRLETALRQIGTQGGDSHSQLFRPGVGGRAWPLVGLGARYARDGTVILVYPGSAAELGGLQVGDRIDSINGVRLYDLQARLDNGLDDGVSVPYALTVRRQGLIVNLTIESGGYYDLLTPVINRPARGVVYLETFGTYGTGISTDEYNDMLTDAHARLSEAFNQAPTCGYVLDVRRNTGGVAFPVLLPMMPLVGDVLFGTSYRPEGMAVGFGRYDSVSGQISGGAITGSGRLRPAIPAVIDATLPVAVLTSRATASMGEFSAVMLLGDESRSVRIFGEQTAGLLSFLGFYNLYDGGAIWIARANLTDRIGRTYPDGLIPDQPVVLDWARHATPSDPALNAALSWLNAQGC